MSTFAPGTQVRFAFYGEGSAESGEIAHIPVGTVATVISTEAEETSPLEQILTGVPPEIEWVKLEFDPKDFVPAAAKKGSNEFHAAILEAVDA